MVEQKDKFFDIPNAIITSRGKTVRLLDGSYEKVTYSPAWIAMLEAMSYNDFADALSDFQCVPEWESYCQVDKTFVLCVADL